MTSLRSKNDPSESKMSEEEVPFKSMKITLSEEAIEILDELRKSSAFRSYFMTIEECIRAIDIITKDISAVWSSYQSNFPPEVLMKAFRRHSMRLHRFLRIKKQ